MRSIHEIYELKNQQDGHPRCSPLTYHLVCQKQDIVQAEFAVTTIKKIFERWTKSTEDQCIVVAFSSKPVDGGDADASQALLKLVLKSRLYCTGRFKLDSNFLLGKNVDPEVDNS